MRQRRAAMGRPSISVVLALLASLTAAACRTADEPAAPQEAAPATRTGGTVTIAAEQFPTNLNVRIPPLLAWTGRTAGMALARGYRLTPDFRFDPWLFDGDCKVAGTSPFTVSCAIRREARWSDGVDITADDFKFTVDVVRTNNLPAEGYNKIERVDVKGPKAFDMVFSEVHVPWRAMWAGPFNPTLPKHVLDGKRFSDVWNTCICSDNKPFGSGPFLVEKFDQADRRLELVRNEAYWDDPKPTLDRIVFIHVADADAQVNALGTGGLDMIYPTAQIGLAEKIGLVRDAVYEPALGTSWEHLDMLTTVPGLDDVEVRRAIATALPRQELVDKLVKPADPRATVLNNVFFMNNQPQYKPNWSIYPEAGDPVRARQILERAGYVRGPSPDDPYRKGNVTLEFSIGVTSGNRIRELAEVVVIDGLKKAGIRLAPENDPEMVARASRGTNYHLTIFAWTGQPDPGGTTFWRDDGFPPRGQNTTRLSHPGVTALIKDADAELDERRRADLYNRADELLAREGVSSIPLFQRPQPLAYRSSIVGVRNNPTIDSFVWNAASWALKA